MINRESDIWQRLAKLLRRQRKDDIAHLTARDIIHNAGQFPDDIVQWARVSINLAAFMELQVTGKRTIFQNEHPFRVEINAKKNGVNQVDFKKGGKFKFQYTDEKDTAENPVNGYFEFGIRRGYDGSFYGKADHLFFAVWLGRGESKEFEFNFHYTEGRWKWSSWGNYSVDRNRAGSEYSPAERYEIIGALVHPFQTFLTNLGEPKWQKDSGTMPNSPMLDAGCWMTDGR